MRIGEVKINHSYIVDLDNPEMVMQARDELFEDIVQAWKTPGELGRLIVTEKCDASASDIPDRFFEDDDLFEDGTCIYCGARCFEGSGCDERNAGGFDDN